MSDDIGSTIRSVLAIVALPDLQKGKEMPKTPALLKEMEEMKKQEKTKFRDDVEDYLKLIGIHVLLKK